MTNRSTQLYVRVRTAIDAIANGERGAGMVEYALLVVLVGVALIVAIGVFAGALNDEFSAISTAVADA